MPEVNKKELKHKLIATGKKFFKKTTQGENTSTSLWYCTGGVERDIPIVGALIMVV